MEHKLLKVEMKILLVEVSFRVIETMEGKVRKTTYDFIILTFKRQPT